MKTLKTIMAFIILNSTFTISSNAQIIYTDVNPDSSYSKTSSPQNAGGSKAFSFDINGDALPDVKITIDSHRFGTFQNFYYASSVTVKTFNSTKISVADSGNSSAGFPLALVLNSNIKNQTWKSFNSTSGILNNGTFGSGGNNSCLWQNSSEKYLGVRLIINGKKHYAWIRLTTTAYYNPTHFASGTIKDYAYDSTSGHSIHAGATSGARLTIEDNSIVEESGNLSIYPNPATSSVTIKFPSDEAGEIQIVNLFGQIVFSEKINAEEAQIDVSRFTAGMYVVRWSSGENNETKTFSVTK